MIEMNGRAPGEDHRAVVGSAMYRLILIAMLVLLVVGCGASAQTKETKETKKTAERPNVVFILTDDLDSRLLASHLSAYPNIRNLAANGVTFENAFVTNALCCPSRSTILTGLYSHNHGVMTNTAPGGGASAFRTLEPTALPVWLHKEGYDTGYVGKYLNGYDGVYDPPGWDEWQGIDTGTGADREVGQRTDVFSKQADTFVKRRAGKSAAPFFLQVAPIAPHGPARPYPRHSGLFAGEKAPQPPSFDERDVSDKPRYVRKLKPLTRDKIDTINKLHRNRLRSMKAVDEMVGRLVATLRKTGELDNTYVVFTSDNGIHLGHHRLTEGKRLAYDEDIRVPLIVRGPGVPAGVTRGRMVLNNDLAPTFAEWTGATPLPVDEHVDGRSLVPVLRPTPPSGWRTAFLAEAAPHKRVGRPAYRAVRTEKYLYVSYKNGEKELYNLKRDPYELRNFYPGARDSLKQHLRSRLSSLAGCEGAGCRSAEGR